MDDDSKNIVTASSLGLPGRRAMMQFVIENLKDTKEGLSASEIEKRIINHFKLNNSQIETMLLSGSTTIFKKEIAWSRQMAVDKGYIKYNRAKNIWIYRLSFD